MPAGAPLKITKDKLRKLEEAFALGCTDIEAFIFADVKSATFYDYQRKHPEFSERKAELKKTPVLLARKTVIKDIQTDSALALKFLERRQKNEFAPMQKTELSGSLNINMTEDEIDRQLSEIDAIEGTEAKKTETKTGEDKV